LTCITQFFLKNYNYLLVATTGWIHLSLIESS